MKNSTSGSWNIKGIKDQLATIIFFFLLLTLISDKQLARITESFRNLRYLITLPDNYGKDTTARWPVILFLHGSKECGNDLEKVKENGPPKLIEMGRKFPFIVVSPQIRFGNFWEPDLLNILLKKIELTFRVDTNRIYLTGLSLGGYGTWYTAFKYPSLFAAIAPVCGGGNPKQAWKIRHLPVWIFHGARDHTVPLSRSTDMASGLLQYNNMKLTIYPDAEHDSWTETYNNDDLYKWFLQHKRFRFSETGFEGPPENYTGLFSSGRDAVTIIMKEGKLLIRSEAKTPEELVLHHANENALFFAENSLKEIKYTLDKNGKMSSFIFYNKAPITFFRIR